MKHSAPAQFWVHYRRLPPAIQKLADKNFALLRSNPRHPSLRLKKVGNFWSVRVGSDYRAVAAEWTEGLAWFWIGPHKEYEKLIS